MAAPIHPGDCVRIPDGRIARVRDHVGDKYRVRVRRQTSNTHRFLVLDAADLEPVQCPRGWMSPEGYNSYLKITLAKMRERGASRSKAIGSEGTGARHPRIP